MGQTLSSAAQWTTAKEGTGRGRLEYTPTNETIINRIIAFVEGFPGSHPEESKIGFRQSLVWITGLNPAQFTGSGYQHSDDAVVSDAVDKSGRPLLSMKKIGSNWEISVSSFTQIDAVLKHAGDKKLSEARLCLEANHDPVARILGDRFARVAGSDQSAYRFVEEILKGEGETRDGEGEGDGTVKEKKVLLKLLLLLKDFDDKLMEEAVKTISSEVKLTPPEVDRAVAVLQEFSGEDEGCHVLKEVTWATPYSVVFSHGCRAPFHRQVNGDISYIVAYPHGTSPSPIFITANTNGYFINGGLDNKTNDLNFEKQSSFYRDLVALLRDTDSHFASLIDQTDIFKTYERSKSMKEKNDTHSSSLSSSELDLNTRQRTNDARSFGKHTKDDTKNTKKEKERRPEHS